jgi:integrase
MSVRKRKWTTHGENREAWIADYVDQGGERHIKTFATKTEALTFHAQANVEVAKGTHTADRRSPTIAQAAELWLQSRTNANLEPATLAPYRSHVRLHINPLLGAVRLSQLTAPMVRNFEDRLAAQGRSPAMVHRVMVSLGSIVADAFERGLVAQNVVRGRPQRTRRSDRRKPKLLAGTHIPTPNEIRNLIPHLQGRWRPLFLVAAFTGLRASELCGLRWDDVDLKHGELHVRQRVDRYNNFGPPKSDAGSRTIPLLPMIVKALREHKVASRHSALGLVFPSSTGKVLMRTNLVKYVWQPLQIKAGIVTKAGKAKYTGLHALRHFYASWCINRRVDGGLELPLKTVQARLGHASIKLTADTYGHLFPRGDDTAELAAAEKAFLGA